jgi:hypothetical protein
LVELADLKLLMKKILFFMFFLSFFNFFYAISQPCGVVPGFDFEVFNKGRDWSFETKNILSPNWKVYEWKWFLNNSQLISNQSTIPIFTPNFFPFGYFCLQQWATDTLTNDSCFVNYCNILYKCYDPYIEILANNYSGTDVFFNTDPPGLINFGDGTPLYSGSSVYHTYPSAGDYLVTYHGTVLVTRKIHVGNGYANINNLNGSGSIISVCDTLQLGITTVPPFNYGVCHIEGYNAGRFGGANLYSNGTMYNATLYYPIMPGSYYAVYELNDTAPVPGTSRIVDYFKVPICGPPDTVGGYVFFDIDADGIRDTNEVGIANKSVLVENIYGSITDSTGYYEFIVPRKPVSFQLANTPAASITYPFTVYYIVSLDSGVYHGGYDFGISNVSVSVCGKVYIDFNQDSVYNPLLDEALSNVTIKITKTNTQQDFYTTTNNSGDYCIELTGGNYKIVPFCNNIYNETAFPDSIIINALSGSFMNNDFAITSPISGSNPEIIFYGTNQPRPGTNYVIYEGLVNRGLDSCSVQIELNYDTLLSFITSNPSPDSIDTVNHYISWQSGTIKAGKFKHLYAIFDLPSNTPLGTNLVNLGSLNINTGFLDYDTTNNNSYYVTTVVGSYDPNNKQVSPIGLDSIGAVGHDTNLNYHINFQNVGTAPAYHIIVQDELDDDLDMNTIMLGNASHPYQFSTYERTLTWTFQNINLPDSTSNESASHGFIEFSIKPIQGLPDGTEIENSANIYFDFNSPVVTNTALNTLQTNITSINNTPKNDRLVIYPVPFDKEIMVNLPESMEGFKIVISDITGRTLITNYYPEPNYHSIKIPTSQLSSGIYLVEVYSNQERYYKKILK